MIKVKERNHHERASSRKLKIPKVLLLNPPSKNIIFRDLYHTFSSKGSYVWAPADILILSASLGHDFYVSIIDCVADKLNEKTLFNKTKIHKSFDFIISLTSSLSWNYDKKVFRKMKDSFVDSKLIIVGDFGKEHGALSLSECDEVDGMLLDFTSTNLLEVLKNWDKEMSQNQAPHNWVLRTSRGILKGPITKRNKVFEVGTPHHEQLSISKYRQPLNRRLPVATILGSVGCPFMCGFCSQSSIAWTTRPAEEIHREIQYLYELGVREIMFRDQLMEASRKNLLRLCDLLEKEGPDITWFCNSRADTLDDELIAAMHRAGCHTVLIGIETANDNILAELKAKKSRELTETRINSLRDKGISVIGYFILGLPGEKLAGLDDTIDYACNLNIDLASFATPSPDYGTQLRTLAIEKGLVDPSVIFNVDRSKTATALNKDITPKTLEHVRRKAVRRFYLRPRQVLRVFHMTGANPQLMCNAIINFLQMARNYFFGGRL
jgi:tRNA A37 methylthiotransferase MiaB